jgi:hypothetical protein
MTGAAVLALFVVSSLAGTAVAATLPWTGTFTIVIGDFPTKTWVGTGGGFSTTTQSVGYHLDSLRLPGGGLTVTGAATKQFTDPDTPTLISLQMDPGRPLILPRGTLAPISGGGPLTQNTLTGKGLGVGNARLKQCINFVGCGNFLPIPITVNGTIGAGIGGTVTINTFSKGPGLKISNTNSPWTLGEAVISGNPNRITPHTAGSLPDYANRFIIHTTRTVSGFQHGPASATSSSTAQNSGVIQLVTPVITNTSLGPPNNFLAVFGILRLHLVPEPGMLLLIGSGIAGLVVLGRHRMRK